MTYKPNDTIAFQFTTTSATGSLINADSTPTGNLVENGVDDGAVTVTITNPATGVYKGSAVIPTDYIIGTHIEIRISATIGGISTASVFDFGTIETKRVAELNDIATGDLMGLADGAITASKFDESTAFPITAADTGSTYIARAPDGNYTLDTIASLVSGIGSGTGSALYFAAVNDNVLAPLKGVTFVGTQTSGTYSDTQAEDGVFHTITDSGTATDIDIVYYFTVGSNRRANEVSWKGHITKDDVIEVYAYDFSTSSWDTSARKIIKGLVGSSTVTVSISLLEKHTGTGSEAGHVYLRFQAIGESSIALYTDELLAVGQAISSTTGYSDGAVWVNNAGEAGTTPDVNGTADNPCPWADAQIIATAKGLSRFHIENGDTITLSSALTEKTLLGNNWLLALGGQDISGTFFSGAKVTGIASGTSNAKFDNCAIGEATIPSAGFITCGIGFGSGLFTAASAGQYSFVNCFSLVPGSGTPHFDFSGLGSTTGVNIRRWSGGANIIGDADINCSLEIIAGGGQTITTGGGNFEIRGNCRSIDITLSASETVQIAAITGPITISGTASAAIVNIYEMHSTLTNTSIGSTVNDLALNDFDASTTGVIVTTVNDKAGYSLTSAYDTAKTAAQAGDAMDIVSAPNTNAITAIQSGLATPTNITAGTISTVTNLTNAPTVGDLTAAMKSSVIAAATSATPTISSVTTVTNLTNLPTAPTDWLTATAVKADAVTKIQSGLATPTNITAGTIDNVTNTVAANVVSIDSSTESATNLAASTQAIVIGTISNSLFLPTKTEFEAADITASTTGQYISRIVIFVTGNLKGQMKDIIGYSLVGDKGHFTVSSFTSPPANGDTFVII